MMLLMGGCREYPLELRRSRWKYLKNVLKRDERGKEPVRFISLSILEPQLRHGAPPLEPRGRGRKELRSKWTALASVEAVAGKNAPRVVAFPWDRRAFHWLFFMTWTPFRSVAWEFALEDGEKRPR
jgi:hypothetical protein